MPEIKISVVKTSDPDAVLALYRHAGWWQLDDNPAHSKMVEEIIAKTYCFVIAEDGDLIIGMGRAISDSVSDAYIQDVTVHSDYRGRGIGKALIHKLIEHLRENSIQWIGLISEPGYERFYESLGFARMEGYTPFLLKQE